MRLWHFLLSQKVTLHAPFVHKNCLLGGSWKISKCQQISLWRRPFYIENLSINPWSQQLMAQSCNQQSHILLVINAAMAGKQERMPIVTLNSSVCKKFVHQCTAQNSFTQYPRAHNPSDKTPRNPGLYSLHNSWQQFIYHKADPKLLANTSITDT